MQTGRQGRAVVVGAGPAGATAALHLANRGFSVVVIERRPRPDQDPKAHVRAYPMVISRGVPAVRATGMTPSLLDPTQQRFRQTVVFGAQGVSLSNVEADAFIMDRTAIAQQLVELAEAHPAAIALHFQTALQSIDFAAQRIVGVQHQDGQERRLELPYDLLVGADGASSRTRQLMQEARLLTFRTVYEVVSGFKVFSGLKAPASAHHKPSNSSDAASQTPDGKAEVSVASAAAAPKDDVASRSAQAQGMWLQSRSSVAGVQQQQPSSGQWDPAVAPAIFAAHAPLERLYFMAGATSTGAPFSVGFFQPERGLYRGCVFGQAEWNNIEQDMLRCFPQFPREWSAEIADQVHDDVQQQSHGGRLIRCSRLVGPRTVLLGDAAHAMTSNLGQGANSALEDVALLMRALDECGGDVQRALPRYERARLPDVRAMQKLEAMFLLARGTNTTSPLPLLLRLECQLTAKAGMAVQALLPQAITKLAMAGRRYRWPTGSADPATPAPGATEVLPGDLPGVKVMKGLPFSDALRSPEIPFGVILRALRIQAGLAIGGAAATLGLLGWGLVRLGTFAWAALLGA